MTTWPSIGGRALVSEIRCGPVPIANSIRFNPGWEFAVAIASRSEPAPLLFVVVTTIVSAITGIVTVKDTGALHGPSRPAPLARTCQVYVTSERREGVGSV